MKPNLPMPIPVLASAIFWAFRLNQDEEWLSSKDAAQILEVPRRRLEQAFQKMVARGWLVSYRGPTGGYCLTEETKDLSAWNVIFELGEGYAMTYCTMFAVEAKRKKPHELYLAYRKANRAYRERVGLEAPELQKCA